LDHTGGYGTPVPYGEGFSDCFGTRKRDSTLDHTSGYGTLVHGIQVFLEDKQYSCNEDCNVPTFGHYYIIECYADQSSQMGVIASIGATEGFYWALLSHGL
jgi:hypothetical protein